GIKAIWQCGQMPGAWKISLSQDMPQGGQRNTSAALFSLHAFNPKKRIVKLQIRSRLSGVREREVSID
ncbi:MAG: hypothetical protein AAF135_26595, partial [Bacteroidota bacterium]